MDQLTAHAVILGALCILSQQVRGSTPREDPNHWRAVDVAQLKRALDTKHILGDAKNVIVFIGDGMGLSTVTASRIYGKTEKGFLAFEQFAHVGVLKTYSANKLVPDSCSTATAMFCGVKANQRTGGVDATVEQNDCDASLKFEARLDSILAWAQAARKRTGFVTTTRVTHATPAALYAHTANRYWECEAKMPPNATRCKDIARQLVEDLPGRNINVIMGGGRQVMQSNVTNSTSDPVDVWSCYSSDGRDLIRTWSEEKLARNVSHQVLLNSHDLKTMRSNSNFTLGIFANGHLMMEHERDKSPKGMPSLVDMTTAAIRLLRNNDTGFVLMVEGGLIDFAHHRGKARKALSETIAFSEAIEEAIGMVSMQDTLIVVTSDHSHPLVISGYADRNTLITGIAQPSKIDGVPYTTLLYGIGGENNYKYSVVNHTTVVREDPTSVNTTDFEYSQQAGVRTAEVTHDGTDVLVYAQGPWAHLFHTVHEQTYVAQVIAYAAAIGPYAGWDRKSGTPMESVSAAASDAAAAARKSHTINVYLLLTIVVVMLKVAARCGLANV